MRGYYCWRIWPTEVYTWMILGFSGSLAASSVLLFSSIFCIIRSARLRFSPLSGAKKSFSAAYL